MKTAYDFSKEKRINAWKGELEFSQSLHADLLRKVTDKNAHWTTKKINALATMMKSVKEIRNQYALFLSDTGHESKEIAELLNLTPSGVRQMLRKLRAEDQ